VVTISGPTTVNAPFTNGAPIGGDDYGSGGLEEFTALAIDGSGVVFLGGVYEGAIDLGNSNALPAPADRDVFLIRVAADGTVTNAAFGGSTGVDALEDCDVDASGDIVCALRIASDFSFGATSLPQCAGAAKDSGSDGWLIKLDGDDLSCVWAVQLGNDQTPSTQSFNGVAIEPAGDVFAIGDFTDRVEIFDTDNGAANATHFTSTTTFLLMRFNADGKLLTSKHLPNPGAFLTGRAIATDGASVYAAGSYSDADVDVEGGVSQTLLGSPGGSTPNGFIVRYELDFSPIWSVRVGGDGPARVQRIALGAGGVVFAVGSFEGPNADVGDRTDINSSGIDAFLAKYNASGVGEWLNTVGTPGTDRAFGVDLDEDGHPIFTGHFQGDFNFGTGTVSAVGADAFAVKVDKTLGTAIWHTHLTGTATDLATEIAVDPSTQRVYVAGGTESPTLSGGGFTLNGAASRDLYWLHLGR
jgi:hypothetical protein